MSDVLVRHCRLRIVRAGGWSWGPDPDSLLAAALAALPEVVAERVETVAARHVLDDEVVGAVRVTVRVTLDAIRARDGAVLGAALEAPLEAAFAGIATHADAAVAGEVGAGERDGARSPPGDGAPAARADRAAARSPAQQLAAWWREGVLEEMLRGWPAVALAAWDLAVGGTGLVEAAALSEKRAALVSAGSRLAAHPSAAHSAAVVPAGDAALPAPGATASHPAPRPAANGTRRRPAVVEARALPFLMLVPLARLGYLDALGPALAAARLAGREGAFASALARKALDPPENGWRRGTLDAATAAAAAGAETVDEEGIAALARAAGGFAAVLDSIVTRAVLTGHDAAAHLVLHRGADLVLLDPDGGFPAAVGAEAAIAAAGRASCSALRVTVPASAPPVLAALDAAGVAFVTAAPPGRHESWHRAGPGRWTNAEPGLARRCPAADETGLDELLAALQVRLGCAPGARSESRPGAPAVHDGNAFERSLTLAAGVALGMIAWDLWREREATDATLALRRLGDLDARVRAEPGCVRVTIPLGRRHRDLTDAGLLQPVALPWLDSTLELGGG